MVKAEQQKYKMLSQTTPNNTPYRKARTRTLIQLGGLIEKSGLLENFDIVIVFFKITLQTKTRYARNVSPNDFKNHQKYSKRCFNFF